MGSPYGDVTIDISTVYDFKELEPLKYDIRFERRGLRWWWVCESEYSKMELGPFWTRWGAVRAAPATKITNGTCWRFYE